MQHKNIGQAAAAAGVTPKMVRHYESLGLIPEVSRTEAGYRLYGEHEIAMLRFIRQSRSLGFSLQRIEELMSLWQNPDRASPDVKQVAQRQLEELEQRQRELDQMRATLSPMVSRCRGDHSAHCVILDHLASPGARVEGALGAIRTRRAPNVVRSGEKQPVSRRAVRGHQDAPVPGHMTLATWAQAFSRPSAA